ncbi:myeloid cell surface antigen CD33-like [Mustelus asterias]
MIGKSYFLLSLLQVGLSQKWKVDIPQKVTAQEGSCVQIPCHYSYPTHLVNQSRDGLWFNNEEWGGSSIAFHSKGYNRVLPWFRNRTRLSGDLKDGDCSLIINNLRREDAGPYYFRIEFDGRNRYSYYPVTQLHVSNFTDKPTIFPAEIIAGKRVDISCTFNTMCNGTAPVLTWDTPTDVPGSVSNTVTQHGVTLTYTSVLTLIPSLKHHGHNLTCRVRYPSVSSEQILVLSVPGAVSNQWKVGLLGAGITLCVELSGFIIFKCVRKNGAAWLSTASFHKQPTDNLSLAGLKKDGKVLEMESKHGLNPDPEGDLYANCDFSEDAIYGNVLHSVSLNVPCGIMALSVAKSFLDVEVTRGGLQKVVKAKILESANKVHLTLPEGGRKRKIIAAIAQHSTQSESLEMARIQLRKKKIELEAKEREKQKRERQLQQNKEQEN